MKTRLRLGAIGGFISVVAFVALASRGTGAGLEVVAWMGGKVNGAAPILWGLLAAGVALIAVGALDRPAGPPDGALRCLPICAVTLSALVSGCERSPPQSPSEARSADAAASTVATSTRATAVVTAAPASASAAALAPVGSPADPAPQGPFVELPVEGFGPAVASVPAGSTRRAVVVATHGNYDRAEWQCEVWRRIVGDRAFVLCPGGAARTDSPSREDIRFTYATNAMLEREIAAGLSALSARFGDRVDATASVYAGFSLGAIMGVAIATRGGGPARFPALVLVEGGHDRWTHGSAQHFARGGGRRVLFACGQPACAVTAKQATAMLARTGIEARVAVGGNVGHTYDGPVADAVRASFDWVIEGDARFAP